MQKMMNSFCTDDLLLTARLGLFLGFGLGLGVMGATLEEGRDNVAPVDVVAFEGLSAAEATKAITLPDGFAAHLFASEPDVIQPIAFCLDDRGRVWVAEGNQYPRRAEGDEGRDRILVLEDTDGDHRYDKKTVFADKLNLVSGLDLEGYGLVRLPI
jgi:hypothetical protein